MRAIITLFSMMLITLIDGDRDTMRRYPAIHWQNIETYFASFFITAPPDLRRYLRYATDIAYAIRIRALLCLFTPPAAYDTRRHDMAITYHYAPLISPTACHGFFAVSCRDIFITLRDIVIACLMFTPCHAFVINNISSRPSIITVLAFRLFTAMPAGAADAYFC